MGCDTRHGPLLLDELLLIWSGSCEDGFSSMKLAMWDRASRIRIPSRNASHVAAAHSSYPGPPALRFLPRPMLVPLEAGSLPLAPTS